MTKNFPKTFCKLSFIDFQSCCFNCLILLKFNRYRLYWTKIFQTFDISSISLRSRSFNCPMLLTCYCFFRKWQSFTIQVVNRSLGVYRDHIYLLGFAFWSLLKVTKIKRESQNWDFIEFLCAFLIRMNNWIHALHLLSFWHMLHDDITLNSYAANDGSWNSIYRNEASKLKYPKLQCFCTTLRRWRHFGFAIVKTFDIVHGPQVTRL